MPPPDDVDRPLSVLPDFSLTCDASGACCGVYGSILFTPLEAARARVALPLVRGRGEREDRVFTPEQGTGDAARLAVALVDNCCAYLGGDGRCGSTPPRGGRQARRLPHLPRDLRRRRRGVRVSLGVECPCALDSVGRPAARRWSPEGADARGSAAGRAGDRAARAPRDRRGRRGPARRVRALVALFAAQPPPAGSVAALWSLADAVERCGLDESVLLARARVPASPDVNAVLPSITGVVGARRLARAQRLGLAERAAIGRSASRAIAAAAASLLDPAALAAALAAPSPDPAGEAFYLRAVIHGHQLVGRLPLEPRAPRSRGAPPRGPGDGRALPSARRPLTILEAMMRGHGIEVYAREVSVMIQPLRRPRRSCSCSPRVRGRARLRRAQGDDARLVPDGPVRRDRRRRSLRLLARSGTPDDDYAAGAVMRVPRPAARRARSRATGQPPRPRRRRRLRLLDARRRRRGPARPRLEARPRR